MNNISIIRDKCVGCFSCVNKCPTNAIQKIMKDDGFYYPIIDENVCIECGLCLKVCPVKDGKNMKSPISSYLVLSKNKKEINSSSGGLFLSLAMQFIKDFNGYVSGCVMNENNIPVHVVSNDVCDVYRMQGSKYVETDMKNIYIVIGNKLKERKKVLFSGTPCQCSAIKNHFNNHENLYCVDIICHGTPSRELWKKDINGLKEKYDFDNITFRYKDKYEKSGYSLSLLRDNKLIKRISYKNDGYYSLFMQGRSFRKSCYLCQYACSKRISDITMGDCNTWLEYAEFFPDKALSIALINTSKGKELWEKVKNNLYFIELDYEKEKMKNKQLSEPVNIKKRLSDEEMLMLINGEKNINDYCIGITKKDMIKSLIKKIFPVKTREYIRKILK